VLNVLDLFSGTGELGRALHQALAAHGIKARTVAYCERESSAQGILLSRQMRGALDVAPICTDVRQVSAAALQRALGPVGIDAIVGGFPCQDISVAGLGVGMEAGKRSSLFFEILRLAGELGPNLIALENVPAITSRGGGRVVAELAALGYDCRWATLSAEQVGATHKRDRWWLLAYASQERRRQAERPALREERHADERGEGLGHTDREGLQKRSAQQSAGDGQLECASLGVGLADAEGQFYEWSREAWDRGTGPSNRGFLSQRPPYPGDRDGWARVLAVAPELRPALKVSAWITAPRAARALKVGALEPAVRGMAAWLTHRNDRIRACGNGVDFVCAKEAYTYLLGG